MDNLNYLKGLFRLKFLLCPVVTENIKYSWQNRDYVGYTNVYLFGFRVARICRTKPWEH